MNLDDTNVRKMLVTVALMATAIVTTYLRGDLPPGLLSFMETVFAAYVLGEAAHHGITTFAPKSMSTSKEES